MLRAGQAAFKTFLKFYSHLSCLAVYCGGGNNAGDGYVFAKIAKEAGYNVTLYALKTPQDLPAAASHAAMEALAAGIVCLSLKEKRLKETELIVDALLGIGLRDTVKKELAAVIHEINQSALPILALDVPSGLNADTGTVEGVCVNASVTVTFIASKIGLLTSEGPDHSGDVICDALGLQDILKQTLPAAYRLDTRNVFPIFTASRPKNSHKGSFGRVLLIGGEEGMPGAVLLAAQAAARVGAGLVTIATKPAHVNGFYSVLPEALVYGVETAKDLTPLLEKATVCVIGPGLGEAAWADILWESVVESTLPLVVDASALRILARMKQDNIKDKRTRRSNWILTPHPGEAAALLNCSTEEVQSNRYQAIKALQKRYGGYPILKGLGSLISQEDTEPPYLCTAGNPGMASAGMGDVLSGVIAGLIAQGLPLANAAKSGVLVHAAAADLATRLKGERGLLASDLMPNFSLLVNHGALTAFPAFLNGCS